MSWRGNPMGHSLASRGVKTKYQMKQVKGKPKLKLGLPPYVKDQIKHLTEMADDGGKEWIAELSMINGDIIIDDVQVSKELDVSFLRWNHGDEDRNIGYIHYHPAELIPEFTTQDFILAYEIHKLRKNKENMPYTIMGLIYPENGELVIVLYGINPSKTGVENFEGLIAVESDMRDTLDKMKENKELIEMREI